MLVCAAAVSIAAQCLRFIGLPSKLLVAVISRQFSSFRASHQTLSTGTGGQLWVCRKWESAFGSVGVSRFLAPGVRNHNGHPPPPTEIIDFKKPHLLHFLMFESVVWNSLNAENQIFSFKMLSWPPPTPTPVLHLFDCGAQGGHTRRAYPHELRLYSEGSSLDPFEDILSLFTCLCR